MIDLIKVLRLMLTITIIVFFLPDNPLAASGWPPKVGQKVRLKTVDNPNNFIQGTVALAKNDSFYIAKQNDFRIDRIIDRKGNIHTFPYIAKYDSELKSLTGVDSNEETITLLLEEIEKVELTLLAGGKEFDLQFDAVGFHDRVEYSPVFQELVWRGSIISANHFEIWQNRSDLRTIWKLSSITLGVIVGIDSYNSAKKEQERRLGVFHHVDPLTPSVVGIISGLAVGVGGLLLANVVAPDGWRKVSPDKLKLGIGSVGENSVGVVVAFKF
ncbi:MAG: hypothetical protein GY865_01990 [candidate division Zixibacteria bacterium]|nr:hypothetical protein [candidate division Zixibacteria bacterium]